MGGEGAYGRLLNDANKVAGSSARRRLCRAVLVGDNKDNFSHAQAEVFHQEKIRVSERPLTVRLL
jgi:hypothetical protein